VPNPDIGGREKILKVHMKKVPLAPDVNPNVIARGTPGFSGADLANLVNEAALLAARRNKRMVTMREFEEAKDKVMMGAERRSMVMTDDEKKLTAYHEAGHAIVGLHMPNHDPLHKVTIIPRGRALGVTMSLPERDRLSYNKQFCLSKLASVFGGREAELAIFGENNVTNGATSDIQQATRLARAMVMEWGMSEKLGRVRYAANEQEVFLGHSVAQTTNMSEETARLVDSEIRGLIEDAEQTARRILHENIDQLHTLAKALLEYETLSGDEVQALFRGQPIVRETPPEEPTGKPPASSVPVAGRPRSDSGPGLTPEPQPT
jgi:cell division protease FtsH